uniref:Chemokine ligand 34b n=1 Tax=Ctenopharyngodon idella TaxID=7959 RepID=A0A345D716_CTEID|nr:chemokine ligand 34b [Ctenopharyngodon idella]
METQRIFMRSLAVVFIASVIWTITAHPVEKVSTCCKAVSTAELTDPIIGFRLQKQSLPCVKAIIRKLRSLCKLNRTSVVKHSRISQRNKHLTSAPPPASSISEHTRVGGSTQSAESS